MNWAKEIVSFIFGVLMGIVATGIITLTILDNRIDTMQPNLDGMTEQLATQEAHAVRITAALGELETRVWIIQTVVDDCIQIARDEVNAYNRVLKEE